MTAFRNQQAAKEDFYQELEQKPYKKVFDAVFTVSDPKHVFPFLFRGETASKKFEENVEFLFSLIQHYYQEEADQLSLEQKYMCLYKKLHLKLVDYNPSLYWAVTQYIPEKDTPNALKDDFDQLLSRIIFEEFHNQMIEFRKVLEKNLNRFEHKKTKGQFFHPKAGDVKRWDFSVTKKFFEEYTILTTPNGFYHFLRKEWGIKIRREDFNCTEYALHIFDQCQKLCENIINESIYRAMNCYFSKYFPLRANTDDEPTFENYQ